MARKKKHRCIFYWTTLVGACVPCGEELPGVSLDEILHLIIHDYDEIDRIYIEAETIGGG